MLVEGVLTLIIVAALFYVAPGLLGSIKTAAPPVYASNPANVSGYIVDSALNASQTTISSTVVGSLNLSSIGLIMMGVAIMIGGLILIRGYNINK